MVIITIRERSPFQLSLRLTHGFVTCRIGLGFGMALWSAVASWVLYFDPRFFSGGLLMMNGAGVLVVLEYLYNEQPEVVGPYPAPPLRTGTCFSFPSRKWDLANLAVLF